jgi:pimeloyl-ACP methyl ester carboxylesterase
MEYIGKRISYVRKEDELSIVISAYSDKKKNAGMLAWFIAWSLGGLAMFIYLFRAPDSQLRMMILVWLGFWLYFEFKVWKAYTWRRFGKEVIKIGKGHLFYKRDNRGQGKIQTFQTEFIQDLGKYQGRQSDIVSNFMNSYWVVAGETISFKYYGKEILMAMQLEEKELAKLLELIRGEVKA